MRQQDVFFDAVAFDGIGQVGVGVFGQGEEDVAAVLLALPGVEPRDKFKASFQLGVIELQAIPAVLSDAGAIERSVVFPAAAYLGLKLGDWIARHRAERLFVKDIGPSLRIIAELGVVASGRSAQEGAEGDAQFIRCRRIPGMIKRYVACEQKDGRRSSCLKTKSSTGAKIMRKATDGRWDRSNKTNYATGQRSHHIQKLTMVWQTTVSANAG